MGEIFIPDRIFISSLEEKLITLIEDGSKVYDITGKSAKEVSAFIEEKMILVNKLYNQYGMVYSELRLTLKKGETVKTVKFNVPNNKEYIERILFNAFHIR